MKITRSLLVFFLFINWFSLSPFAPRSTPLAPRAAISAPVLKWQGGGCDWPWCQTGWYSSPAVADIDSDGQVEVIAGAYSIFSINGATGELEWRVRSGRDRSQSSGGDVGRTWPDVAVADVDHNGDLEIITAHSGGVVSVYNHEGYFEPGWPQTVAGGSELRSLGVYDLDGNGDLEIMVAGTRSEDQWYVLEHDGSLRPGQWPQHGPDSTTEGWTAGCYNQNLAAGDLDGDGLAEIIGPNDTHYLAGFEHDGQQTPANPLYGTNPDGSPKVWARVGVHVDHAVDLRGYADCGVEHRPNFAHSAPVIADVDGNGTLEVVVVGNVYNCGADPYQDLYEIPYILNGDRTRWANSSFNWQVLPAPVPGAAPLSEDYGVIENAHPNPVVADLDGDGLKEILYASYDGRLHAYWLDKTEHGSWPLEITQPGEGLLRFASEPAVADLDADGQAEVIVATWPQKGSNTAGQLLIVSAQGEVLQAVNLPANPESNWNGGLAAPTLANIDFDADLEVVVNTVHSGVVAYDLPGTASARLLWGTGRGSYQRSGSLIVGDLSRSVKVVDLAVADPGEELAYTIILRNSGPAMEGVTLTDTLPAGLTYSGGLSASSGTAATTGSGITWHGTVGNDEVEITFYATLDSGLAPNQAVTNLAQLDDGQGQVFPLQAVTVLGGEQLYMPLVGR